MNWLNQHIHLTYLVATLIGVAFASLAILLSSLPCLVAWYIVLYASSIWVLWRKQQSYNWLILITLIAIAGIPALFLLSNNRETTK